MLNHLEQLRQDAALITGRTIAQQPCGTDLLQSGPWRLTLELPADPDCRYVDTEPGDCYIGAVVRLHHQHRTISIESCWGICEDFDAGCSNAHPFWDHLAMITRDLAAECLDEPRIRQSLLGKIQTLQGIISDI
jgi:hypothetical protein